MSGRDYDDRGRDDRDRRLDDRDRPPPPPRDDYDRRDRYDDRRDDRRDDRYARPQEYDRYDDRRDRHAAPAPSGQSKPDRHDAYDRRDRDDERRRDDYDDRRRDPYDDRRRDDYDDRRRDDRRYDDRRYDDRRPDDRRDDRRGRDYDRRPQYERVGKRPLDTEGSSSLFVGNLPYDIRDDEFEDIFAKYGKLVSTKLGMNRETRMCRGFGFVTYEDHRDAADAIEKLRDFELRGRRFRLDFDAGITKKQDAGSQRAVPWIRYLRPSGQRD